MTPLLVRTVKTWSDQYHAFISRGLDSGTVHMMVMIVTEKMIMVMMMMITVTVMMVVIMVLVFDGGGDDMVIMAVMTIISRYRGLTPGQAL